MLGRHPLLHLIRIGSRKSTLARLQSYLVGHAIQTHHPQIKIDYIFRESLGDRDLSSPLWNMDSRGVFTREFQQGLIQQEYDLVVHSWKDLELENNPHTAVLPVLARADVRDILLFKKQSFLNPPQAIQIMSSSPRREYNLTRYLKRALPLRLQNKPIQFLPVRGNVQTRIRKWQESEQTQGIVLALAGLDRLLTESFPQAQDEDFSQIRQYIRQILQNSLFMLMPLSENPNAPAQGALAVEVLQKNQELQQLLQPLKFQQVESSVLFERKELKKYGGGCHQKIGVACLPGKYGNFISIRGITDEGKILDDCFLERQHQQPVATKPQQLWPLPGQGLKITRKKIPIDVLPEKPLLVARSSAWQSHWQQKNLQIPIWSAGLKTLYQLAQQDVWVHGSCDGWGETDGSELQHILGHQPQFHKLTHYQSFAVESKLPRIISYELIQDQQTIDIDNKNYFFWMSGYQFDLMLAKFPDICNHYHACGPGITALHLQKHLPSDNPPDIFLNYREWLHYHKADHHSLVESEE